jgi:3-isopropylmalate/(R)-2-methylmalate dehydratase large subunit
MHIPWLQLSNGQTQLLIGTHLIHEVTSPQAFAMLRERGLPVRYPHRTYATVDHIVPTDQREEPFSDPLADAMIKELRKNCDDFGITYFDLSSGHQGIVHVVGPEQGITQPGTTIACGDSHTSTHGAFGAIAFGIGTTQVQGCSCHPDHGPRTTQGPPYRGQRPVFLPGVYAKDVILDIIRRLGTKGGTGYAYEYAGEVFDQFFHGRADDCLQHVDRRRRPGWLREPG